MEVVPKVATVSTAASSESTVTDCVCKNGGRCITFPEEYPICECESGYTGMDCGQLIFQPSHGKNRNLAENNSIPATIAIVSIASLIALVGVYLMWRKYKDAQERHERTKWVQWQEGRRQSRTTIEGPTVVEIPVPANTNPQASALNLSHKAHHTNPSYCVSMENLTAPNDSTKLKNNHATDKQRHLPTIQTI